MTEVEIVQIEVGASRPEFQRLWNMELSTAQRATL